MSNTTSTLSWTLVPTKPQQSNDSLPIFSDHMSAILAITSQNRENYHNSTLRDFYSFYVHRLTIMQPKHQLTDICILYTDPQLLFECLITVAIALLRTNAAQKNFLYYPLLPRMFHLQSEKTPRTLSFKLQRYNKDIIKIFYKSNCHKLKITTEDLFFLSVIYFVDKQT